MTFLYFIPIISSRQDAWVYPILLAAAIILWLVLKWMIKKKQNDKQL